MRANGVEKIKVVSVLVMFSMLSGVVLAEETGDGSKSGFFKRWKERRAAREQAENRASAGVSVETSTTFNRAVSDGGVQVSKDVTSDSQRGTATMTGTGTATKTDDGKDFTIERAGTTAKGADWSSSTTGQGTKTDDGHEWSSTTSGSTESGKTWTTEKDGTAVKNDDGTVTITTDINKTLGDGTTLTGTKETTVTKTEDGRTWSSEGEINGPHGETTIEATGSAVKNGDGTADISVDRTATRSNGATVSTETTGTASKTADGRTVQTITTGTRTAGDKAQTQTQAKDRTQTQVQDRTRTQTKAQDRANSQAKTQKQVKAKAQSGRAASGGGAKGGGGKSRR